MAIFHKQLTVYFYTLEPVPAPSSSASFERGAFPLGKVLSAIRKLDPASEDYRLQDKLFGGETFCILHEDGPDPIMGAYYRDNLAKPLTEYKGEISELELRDGEAMVDATYAAFFPSDVVGLVRTSSKAPGFAKIGLWLSSAGGYACGLQAMREENAFAQLDSHHGKLRRLWLTIRSDRIGSVEGYSTDVAKALRAANEISPRSAQVGIELRSGARSTSQAAWSETIRQEIEELLGVLPDFEHAKVKIAGIKNPVNLRRANIQRSVEISIDGGRRVGPKEAAEALFSAYTLEAQSIQAALQPRDKSR